MTSVCNKFGDFRHPEMCEFPSLFTEGNSGDRNILLLVFIPCFATPSVQTHVRLDILRS